MKRAFLYIPIIAGVLLASCTPGDKAYLQTRSAQTINTVIADGKVLAATKAKEFEETLVAGAATKAIEAKDTAIPALATQIQAQIYASRKIVIDPGHGWAGETGLGNFGVLEKDVTLDVAFRTEARIQKIGFPIQLTRKSDMPDQSYATAKEMIAQASPQIFIALHLNSGGGTGVMACYPSGTSSEASSKYLAQILTELTSAYVPIPSRGIYPLSDGNNCTPDDQAALQGVTSTAVVLKLAYIDNPNDVALLKTRQDGYAQAISEGIYKFYENH